MDGGVDLGPLGSEKVRANCKIFLKYKLLKIQNETTYLSYSLKYYVFGKCNNSSPKNTSSIFFKFDFIVFSNKEKLGQHFCVCTR